MAGREETWMMMMMDKMLSTTPLPLPGGGEV